jgi:hypothetical protein
MSRYTTEQVLNLRIQIHEKLIIFNKFLTNILMNIIRQLFFGESHHDVKITVGVSFANQQERIHGESYPR